MAWLELQLTVAAALQARSEDVLLELGALAVTLLDADADTPDEAAIFEPDVGSTPLWSSLTLLALFDGGCDRQQLNQRLFAQLPELVSAEPLFRDIADQDWERAWMDRYQPLRFGRRLWIYPWNIQPPPLLAIDTVIVRLDPGLAFGSGSHPTTAACLEWLDGIELTGRRVLDYGCGSGVLAIAALRLGAAHALAIDHDPQARAATADNALRNGVAANLQALAPAELPKATQCDLLVANILSGPLAELAPTFADLCAPGAPVALSGILAGQEPELLTRYAACGFTELLASQHDGWVRISGRRAPTGQASRRKLG